MTLDFNEALDILLLFSFILWLFISWLNNFILPFQLFWFFQNWRWNRVRNYWRTSYLYSAMFFWFLDWFILTIYYLFTVFKLWLCRICWFLINWLYFDRLIQIHQAIYFSFVIFSNFIINHFYNFFRWFEILGFLSWLRILQSLRGFIVTCFCSCLSVVIYFFNDLFQLSFFFQYLSCSSLKFLTWNL